MNTGELFAPLPLVVLRRTDITPARSAVTHVFAYTLVPTVMRTRP